MQYQSARFSAMRTGRYHSSAVTFPASVYPQLHGLQVQFLLPRDADEGRFLSQQGTVGNVSYLVSDLTSVAKNIIAEDTAPHFEEVDWKSGVVIEGVLCAERDSVMSDLCDDLVGDFGDVNGVHFVGVTAIPYKFWQVGRDRYDVGMRRATLARAMGRLGMLAAGGKSRCWLLPRLTARTEYQLMELCDRFAGGNAHLESEYSFKPLPNLPVKTGMVYDFCLPWAGGTEFFRVPSLEQIEDGLL